MVISHAMSRTDVTKDGKVFRTFGHSGCGDPPRRHQQVRIHYILRLDATGRKIESTRDGKGPVLVTVGEHEVEGLSLSLMMMTPREKSKFTIAPEYAYGDAGKPPDIPGGATLVYDIEFIEIVPRCATVPLALEAGERLAQEAAVEVREQRYDAALRLYAKGLDLLSEHCSRELDELTNRLRRNSSIVYARLELWEDSLCFADKVLLKEPNDPKALMRKLEALVKMRRTEDARRVLNKGLAITKNDPAFAAMGREVERQESEDRSRSNDVFKRMAGK